MSGLEELNKEAETQNPEKPIDQKQPTQGDHLSDFSSNSGKS